MTRQPSFHLAEQTPPSSRGNTPIYVLLARQVLIFYAVLVVMLGAQSRSVLVEEETQTVVRARHPARPVAGAQLDAS